LHPPSPHCAHNFGQEGIDVKRVKTRIAAGVTILGLGGLTGLALSANHQQASEPVAAKPLVRTKVIRRTIHVTKHAKPNYPAGSSPAARAGGGYSGGYGGGTGVTTGSSSIGSVPPSSSEPAPVTTSSSGASPAPVESAPAPVVTHSSGSHAGSGGGAAPTAPVVTHSSGASAGSGSGGGASTPVVTSSSGGGAGGGGGEHESERGDD
jgi:hypothetical protein